MTLRKEIIELRQKFWRDADISQTGEEIDQLIERVDDIDDRVHKSVEIVTRLSNIEDELETQSVAINILKNRMDDIEFVTSVSTIKVRTPPDPEPSEPFPGYNDLMEQAEEVIPILKATIDQKKRELAHKVVPMTEGTEPKDRRSTGT